MLKYPGKRSDIFVCRETMHKNDGQLYVLAAAVLWGTTGTAQALAPLGATPLSIGTLRLVIGGLGLLIVALMRGSLHRPRSWPLRPTLYAAVSVAAYQLCFFGGVARTGVAIGTIVGIGSAPIMAGLLGWWLRGEPLDWRWLVSTTLAIIGCALLVMPAGEARVDFLGVLLALGAGLAYTLYTLGSKTLLEHYPPDAAMAVIFCLGAVLLLPLLLTTDLHWVIQPDGALVVLHLGLVTTTLAYILFARGLTRSFVATTVTLSLAEPLTAGLLGVVVLGEQLTLLALLGIGLLATGLVLLSIPETVLMNFGWHSHEFSQVESKDD